MEKYADKNSVYEEDGRYINDAQLPWEIFSGRTILVAGATGLIGSAFARAVIYRNERMPGRGQRVGLILMGRSLKRLHDRFFDVRDREYVKFLEHDVTRGFSRDEREFCGSVDYIVHAAGKGSPASFIKDPVGVMNANYIGTLNLLELLKEADGNKLLFISSGETYGKIDGNDRNGVNEREMGHIDAANPRSCYPISKLAGESLCLSYAVQHSISVNIARLCHTYGGDILDDESRVVFQFMADAAAGRDIKLKSSGEQRRSYCYVADAVKGLFYILTKGNDCEIYNVANQNCRLSIKELAQTIADISGVRVVAAEQSSDEKKGDSGIMRAVLDAGRLYGLGFRAEIGLDEGIRRSLRMLMSRVNEF